MTTTEATAEWVKSADAEARKYDRLARRARDERDAAIRGLLLSGWTQRQVAEVIGITPAMIARIAHGRR
jgi:ribosome-binding protein aMBF1 (putative translation factor)